MDRAALAAVIFVVMYSVLLNMKVLGCHVRDELACLMCSDCWDTFWVYYVQVLFTVSLML